MFKVSKTSGQLTRRVETKIVDEKGAVVETVAFKVTYEVADKATHNRLVEEFKNEVYTTDDELKVLLKQHVVGWEGLKGENGDVAFSTEALSQMLEIPQYLIALMQGFTDALTGREVSRRKN